MIQLALFSLLGASSLSFAAPSSYGTADGWADAHSKAAAAVSKLDLSEKVGIVSGVGWMTGNCIGNTYAAPSIGYPAPCIMDSPLGVRLVSGVTAFPAGIQAGATWDRKLIYERGRAMGEEAVALGINTLLGPVGGPLGKNPRGGRNWEGFANDPYLSGVAMVETITGIQDAGAQAVAKHYILNEQEWNRTVMTSDADDRTLHELYLWPFADSVNANVACVMCSYNRLNGSYACENHHIVTEILKGELGFLGYVMSDWDAQENTVDPAIAGLDMAMPGDDLSGDPDRVYWGFKLQDAVQNGSVPLSRLNDMAERILASWYYIGQDKGFPDDVFNAFNDTDAGPDVQGDHKVVARDIARDGIVLLKNEHNILPLNKPKSLAIIGYDAITNPDGPNACEDRSCDNGTLAMGWGSGTAQLPYLVSPYDAIKVQAAKDGTELVLSTSNDISAGAEAAAKADIAMVFINADAGEEYIIVDGHGPDRTDLDPWNNGNELVAAAAEAAEKVVVVIHSVGPLDLGEILSHPSVYALVWAGLQGQETGNALVDVIYGSYAPSGKLPYTIGKQLSDYGSDIVYDLTDDFSEGLYIDYRYFDKNEIEPHYEFGFGLSYTTFNYSGLQVDGNVEPGPTKGKTVPGGASDLYEIVATVTAQITNSGDVAGAEVAQLYVNLPSSAPDHPSKQLRGFDKIMLSPGKTDTVTFELRRKDLSYWDVTSQAWIVPEGEFELYVGASSRDIKLEGVITA